MHQVKKLFKNLKLQEMDQIQNLNKLDNHKKDYQDQILEDILQQIKKYKLMVKYNCSHLHKNNLNNFNKENHNNKLLFLNLILMNQIKKLLKNYNKIKQKMTLNFKKQLIK